MTFVNDTDYPIIVRGLKGTTKSECSQLADEFGSITHSTCVIFEIWGVPFHRTVTFSQPVITDLKVAEDFIEYSLLKPDKTPLLPGERLRLEYPTNGFRSTVVRTVRDADGNIIHQDTFASKYIRVHGITLIGWQEGDPPIGESLPSPNPLTPIQPPEAPATPV
jgi:hypothetical protein